MYTIGTCKVSFISQWYYFVLPLNKSFLFQFCPLSDTYKYQYQKELGTCWHQKDVFYLGIPRRSSGGLGNIEGASLLCCLGRLEMQTLRVHCSSSPPPSPQKKANMSRLQAKSINFSRVLESLICIILADNVAQCNYSNRLILEDFFSGSKPIVGFILFVCFAMELFSPEHHVLQKNIG